MNFVRQNRRMLNRLEGACDGGNIKSVCDIGKIREEHIKDGTHGKLGEWLGVSVLEFIRFVLLVSLVPIAVLALI